MRMRIIIGLSFLVFMPVATPALAYIGPGAGISVVGSLLGLLGTVLLAVGAIFLWPLRRALKKKSGSEDMEEIDTDTITTEEAETNLAAERIREE